jgi:hypothetical protein
MIIATPVAGWPAAGQMACQPPRTPAAPAFQRVPVAAAAAAEYLDCDAATAPAPAACRTWRRTLTRTGVEQHIPKRYINFAMAFGVLVEMLNLKRCAVGRPSR